MKSMKTLLLIALLSSTSANIVSKEEYNEKVLYEEDKRTSPVEECVCLVRHPMMVPVVDYLDSDSHGLSRLIVYLYKDKKTGQIHAYVPGAENQRKFPDISLDLYGNEIFVVNEELTVTTIFEKSKNVVPLIEPPKSSQQTAANGEHALEPEIYPHQLLIYDFTNGDIKTHTESNSKTHTHINPQIQSQIQKQTDTKTYSQIHSQTYSHIHPQSNKQTHTQSYTQNHPQSHTQSHPQTDIKIPSKSPLIGENFNYVYNTVDYESQDTDNSVPSAKSTHPTPSVVEVPDDSTSVDTVPVDVIPGDTIPVESIAVDETVKEDSWSMSTYAPPRRPVSDEDAISAKRVSTAFDVWFKGQIKKVRDKQLTTHYVLDVKTLKDNIEKILQENHIEFTANGKLQDSHGNIISFSRLKLRPVLIGESINYEKVKHRETFVFPRDLTYLEAILITVSYPPKILGIVPLRKVTLPQISQQTETISKSISSKNQTTSTAYAKSNKNDMSFDKTIPKSIQNQPERPMTPKRNSKNKKKVVEPVKEEVNITFDNAHGPPSHLNLENIFGKPPASEQKSSNQTKSTTKAAIDGRKSLNSEKIEKKGSGDGGSSNNRGAVAMFTSILSQTLGKLRDFFPRDNVNEEEENSSDDPLGFRIIGGDPATISGKMLNSRGRSGFIY